MDICLLENTVIKEGHLILFNLAFPKRVQLWNPSFSNTVNILQNDFSEEHPLRNSVPNPARLSCEVQAPCQGKGRQILFLYMDVKLKRSG